MTKMINRLSKIIVLIAFCCVSIEFFIEGRRHRCGCKECDDSSSSSESIKCSHPHNCCDCENEHQNGNEGSTSSTKQIVYATSTTILLSNSTAAIHNNSSSATSIPTITIINGNGGSTPEGIKKRETTETTQQIIESSPTEIKTSETTSQGTSRPEISVSSSTADTSNNGMSSSTFLEPTSTIFGGKNNTTPTETETNGTTPQAIRSSTSLLEKLISDLTTVTSNDGTNSSTARAARTPEGKIFAS